MVDTNNNWINVKRKLPKRDSWVLTWGLSDIPQKDHFSTNGLFGGTILHHKQITHWMPLPSPPKE